MAPMTRGPLPARVYWVRRLMVLGTALLLVVAIARLLGGGSDASDGDTAARTAADTTTSAPSTTVDPGADPSTSTTPTPDRGKRTDKPGKGTKTSKGPVLADPEGECAPADIAVAPKVDQAVAGRDVTVVLQLRTMQSPACTFEVSPGSVTVNITSGKDAIWSSRDCPRAIPQRQVVVRDNVTTTVGVVWGQAKRSGDQCTRLTDWARAGWYHATAAVLGGEPADVQFELTNPIAGTITKTATPSTSPSKSPKTSPSRSPKQSPKQSPKRSPSTSPSGAVEPD